MSAAEPSSLAQPVRRLLWCSAGGRVLHGRTRPAPAPAPGFLQKVLGVRPHAGTIFEFESVDLRAAQAALEAHLEAPGAFSVETAEGARLDFLASRSQPDVTVDCWFFDLQSDELDAVVLDRAAARELLVDLYALRSDREIAVRLRQLERARTAA